MTIGNALTFIKIGQKDGELRRRLVKTNSREELEDFLLQQNLKFTPEEFEEAYSLSLFKCSEHGDAQALMAFRLWWTLLVRSSAYPQPVAEEER
ncbi:MAG TPA: hypothetical protein DHV36_22495 [Desulfobacteraceae bacterium]|nr:hypothetical protein [Desulfobacteraceae bacterium]|tara:strand:+ start:37 stop:318 length:282 start_codon:yes stop_codon:yes gene_type:complete